MKKKILEVKNLKKYFPIKAGFIKRTVGHVKACDDISFDIYEGETLSLVGESGCGKSTTGRAVLKLFEPTDGEVLFKGKDVFNLKHKELIELRQDMQIIFQDPYSSLNPKMSVGDTIGEPLLQHKLYKKGPELDKRISEIVRMCGLDDYHINRYPHEFSGGQRQRIGIARALAMNPSFIVADEPVSALDVSIQSQVINLLKGLQNKMGLSFLFISHDLSVVKHISDRIGVMYLGSLVELTTSDELFKKPTHPYTEALLSAIPVADPEYKKKRILLKGDIPSPANPPSGCKFHTRCVYATDICKTKVPEFKEIETGHYCACHYPLK
ncbi:ABC transporter ATP-binding protein [Helicovermis profundi]|uniref:ATP-binding cassette domain-containing protein n=1 Tax=Helicovermis profundi TaxID=3065157 RepID=A0AAU9E0L2_9FIRM|nr:ATP-binding cassette domain-containing protein [Clostridia bacterium S502]